MKRIPILVAGACFLGCTITVTPLPTYKKSYRHSKHSTQAKKPPAPSQKNIKETWWVENYHKLEAAHGNYTISDDSKIEPMPDGRFKVPDAVLRHYQDLLLVTPSPPP